MPIVYDITPRISPRLAVFPGDTPLARDVLLDMRTGDNITLSTMRSTVHLGAHADAPSHYGSDGRTIEAQPLDRYLGPCQVFHVAAAPRHRVRSDDLRAPIRAARILIRTGTYPDPDRWTNDFAALAPELIDSLAARHVVLIGIDTPSV